MKKINYQNHKFNYYIFNNYIMYKDTNSPETNGIYNDGYFVTNEGNFNSGNGSISFVSNDGTVENNVFVTTNSFPLGDVVQSMSIIDENAYIVVNNSSKIEVASIDSMISVGTIENISSPRYIIEVSNTKGIHFRLGFKFNTCIRFK